MLDLHVAWATFFRWRGLTWLPRLVYAYRAPMLFAGKLIAAGRGTGVVGGVDEQVRGSDYQGVGASDAKAAGSDVLYISAHGRLNGGQFELMLHEDRWRPAAGGLDGDGPRIAVFDACNLVDVRDGNWAIPWNGSVRPRLRLVLGFCSLATVSRASALRGEEFAARLLRGEPVVAAWFTAVANHQAHRRDRPVALAFGKDREEVADMLNDFTLDEVMGLPALRNPVVEMRW